MVQNFINEVEKDLRTAHETNVACVIFFSRRDINLFIKAQLFENIDWIVKLSTWHDLNISISYVSFTP